MKTLKTLNLIFGSWLFNFINLLCLPIIVFSVIGFVNIGNMLLAFIAFLFSAMYGATMYLVILSILDENN